MQIWISLSIATAAPIEGSHDPIAEPGFDIVYTSSYRPVILNTGEYIEVPEP